MSTAEPQMVLNLIWFLKRLMDNDELQYCHGVKVRQSYPGITTNIFEKPEEFTLINIIPEFSSDYAIGQLILHFESITEFSQDSPFKVGFIVLGGSKIIFAKENNIYAVVIVTEHLTFSIDFEASQIPKILREMKRETNMVFEEL